MKGFFGASRRLARGNASRLFGRVPVAGVAAAAVGVIFLLAAPATYAAASLYVNAATGTDSGTCGASTSPCRTIQEAVNNASAGDTIEVAAGTYDDLTVRECTAPVDGSRWPCSASVIISKSLTLRGAQAGTPGSAARAAGSPATESVVTAGPFE